MRHTRAWALATAAALAGLVGGCAMTKAVDTTAGLQAMTAGEQTQHVTYSLMPGALTDDPVLKDKLVALPTLPGKDITFKAYYADGRPRWELTTQRSAVLDALWAGANTADALKAAQDRWNAEYYGALMERILDRVMSVIPLMTGGGVASSQPTQPSGQTVAELKALIVEAIRAELAKPR